MKIMVRVQKENQMLKAFSVIVNLWEYTYILLLGRNTPAIMKVSN